MGGMAREQKLSLEAAHPLSLKLEDDREAVEAAEPFSLKLEDGKGALEALYPLGEQIGEGTFGKVYACRGGARAGTGGVCVKVMAAEGRLAPRVAVCPGSEKAELLNFFRVLDHPNIVRYHRFVQAREQMYIIMERCEGPGLQEHVDASEGGLLPMAEVRSLTRQVLGALAAVHSLGIMHRDVKPANFRFREPAAATLQLLDFETAKACAAEPRAHTVIGTMLFAAPEVFSGVYDRACDLWGAGCMLFLLVSGQLPFETGDVTMLHSMHRDPVLTGSCLLRGRRWDEAPTAHGLVRGLLATEPSARLSAAEAAAHAWLLAPRGPEAAPDADKACAGGEGIGATQSSALLAAKLKRTSSIWNLSEYGGSEDSEDGQTTTDGMEPLTPPLPALRRTFSVWNIAPAEASESESEAD